MLTCALCSEKKCKKETKEKLPKNCLCTREDELEDIKKLYLEPDNLKLAYNSALVESEGYCVMTRLEETIEFANKCGYKKLGVAFCVGLSKEAKILCTILQDHGFEVNSICCKNGSIPKEFIGIKDDEKVKKGQFEAMCNPIGQAEFLNKEGTELNIILGLCVGHDSLFIKHSSAPITVLVVKDRVLAHNPVGALYCADSYFKYRFKKK